MSRDKENVNVLQSSCTDKTQHFDHEHEQDASHSGVSKVQAFNRVLYNSGRSGRFLLVTLIISIGLTMIAYAFDQGLTSQFTAIAASAFGGHANISAINTASQIIRGVSKPFIGKLSDITSRPTTYVVVLVFYLIGFVVAATCQGIPAYTVGICFTAFGKSGLDLLSDIIVGDLTTLQWRAFWSALLSTPFLITVPINGFIVEALIPDHWRWGLGMFAIMIPILMIPAIWTLYGMQSKAEKLGMVSMGASRMRRSGKASTSTYLQLAWQGIIDIDLAGILMLGLAWSLILLPLTLAKGAKGGWTNPSMIAMLVCGFVILGIFAIYEIFFAPKPLMTRRILINRAFMAALFVDFFNQMASSTCYVYLPSYIYIIKEWSDYVWTIYLGATTLALCFFSPLGGLLHRATHRYKTLMIIGAVLKLIGYVICMGANNRSTEATAPLVVSQILLGTGALTVIGARVGSQASVPHEDLASVIAILSLWSTIGSSIGSSISGAIWTNRMLSYMREEVPTSTSDATIRKIYGSIKILKTNYRYDDPVRKGAIVAYTRTNGIIFAVASVLAALPIIFSLMMPNYYLGKQQNAATNTGLDGAKVDIPQDVETRTSQSGVLGKLRALYRCFRRSFLYLQRNLTWQ